MASVYFDEKRKSWRLSFMKSGRRCTVWLGDISASAAQTICRHVEILLAHWQVSQAAPEATLTWALAVQGPLGRKLREWGLVAGPASSDLPNTLRAWIDHYIASRTDLKQTTRNRFNADRNEVCRLLGDKTPLVDITEADADQMAASIRLAHASSTAGKRIKTAKQFFAAAVKSRVLAASPLDHLVAGGKAEKDRDYYVEPEVAELLIQHAKDPLWKLIYALTRYAGFRCPSEILCLKWSDINWETSIIALDAPKTGLRRVPIFHQVRPHLEALPRLATSPYVCHRYRSSDASSFTRHLEATCRSAGIECWAKPWVNMRASARTDMELHYPVATCNAWMGHSTKVAREHYARVANADWQKAIGPQPDKTTLRIRKDA